ncbi:hypothetical protein N7481_005497 [Penicillium waksmanii]|uniref:uncharacterized protein n=1 Tax=Penicillium waksmanii TaxID=69791 RepID=UPI002546A8E1|nr:uncharacterized protein N7481_005497 [Penicillium waksmanii]KAJ5983398.1 hypothetical protein N7481_005497 [Penicillium waksmanii]
MSLDEDALETVANGGSIDLDKWAAMVEPLLERLEYIVYNVFPMPKAPPRSQPNKENAAPGDPQSPSQPQADTTPLASTERVPDSQPQSSSQANDALPPQLAQLLSSIRSSIQSFFTSKPPHTIQRFSELILRPTAHYRTLPAYLRAVDRVISVTSDAAIFPFTTPANTNAQLNGLGSDESLGGALLTPIPWLTNASFGAEGISEMEEEDSASAQAHNIETGGSHAPDSVIPPIEPEDSATTAGSPPADSSEEVPHARGPPLLGVQDLGLQDGQGVEMTLGEQESQGAGADGPADIQPQASTSEANPADKDGDIVLDGTQTKEEEGKMEDTAAADSAKASET